VVFSIEPEQNQLVQDCYNRLSLSVFLAGAVMSDVTQILSRIESGDPSASEQLLPLVYDELRKLAAARLTHEKPGQTLVATALVHEAYIRLVDGQATQGWNSRGHFFAAAAEAMRRILIENARGKRRTKRGGNRRRIELDEACLSSDAPSDDVLALNEALERLAVESPARAELVKLRYFAGLTIDEAAGAMNISLATAKRYWTYSRAWLYHALAQSDEKV
jgi:RNA polymerase sigma factor (TIGR02999 family)